jgi:uncharacterized protein (TIGR00255 family)
MIRSMTGFGRSERRSGAVQVGVEIRCVNHRYAESRVRVPRVLASMEETLRQRLMSAVVRGRADASVSVTGLESGAPVEVNHSLVAAYLKAGSEIAARHGIAGSITLESLLTLPGAVSVRSENDSLSAAQRRLVEGAFDAAVKELSRARLREGSHLAADIRKRLRAVAGSQAAIAARARKAASRWARRVKERAAQIASVQVDPSRLAQEVALLASRSDITEELVRLAGHVKQARALLGRSKEPVGKKLDFLVQEMHRETNTINAKAEDLEISRLALAVKGEIEKIREQVQNLE